MKEVFIVNFFSANNFDAAMVGYALQYTLKNLNYEAKHIDCLKRPQNYTFHKFTKKFIKTTPQALYPEALENINKDMSIVLVGSDQVLRTHVSDPYYLSWVYGYKTIISYAASFGINKFYGNIFDFIKARKLLSRFDALSVREKSGVDIMKNTFGLNSYQHIDPTLLLNPEDYQNIIDSEYCTQSENYVGIMFLDQEHWDEFKKSALYEKLILKNY